MTGSARLILLFLLAVIPIQLAAQVADSSPNALRQLVEDLPPSAQVRVRTLGSHWTGRLAARPPDSLALAQESGTRTIRLSAIDTLWVRGQKHDALLAGAGFGALMFCLLQIGRGPGDPATSARLGGILFLGAAGGGMLIDAISEQWSRRYPE
jgi:hypothetical protein